MKTLILILLMSVATRAQGVPPVRVTKVVELTASTRLEWKPNPAIEKVAGYWATMSQGTNQWRAFTTNSFVPLLTLNTNLADGEYGFRVTAVNGSGLESEPSATMTTNLSRIPSTVVEVVVKLVFE